MGRLAAHQLLAAPTIDSIHAWLAQKERQPAAKCFALLADGSDALPGNGNVQSKQTCRAVPTSGLLVIHPESIGHEEFNG